MMNRSERAKQFMAFDAMKGLQEALRDREERHSRVERHDIGEEQQEQNSRILLALAPHQRVYLSYYAHFHDVEREGEITAVNLSLRYLVLDEEKIRFEDIYAITEK